MKIESWSSSHRGCIECGRTNTHDLGRRVSVMRSLTWDGQKEGEGVCICIPCLSKALVIAIEFIPEWEREHAKWDGEKYVYD